MNRKYEISVWEDYLVSPQSSKEKFEPYYDEKRLAIIGSNSMETKYRAVEPKLVSNVNGTHTFTFKMFYKYKDEETNELLNNPFISLLVNERKIKVFWKDEWYDFIIKSCQEDSSGRHVIYTCKDIYINELSKTGFDLNFSYESNNNQGTITELAERVLKGTDWSIDKDNSQIIEQVNEEPLYKIKFNQDFKITNIKTNSSTILSKDKEVLVFYSYYDVEKKNFKKDVIQAIYVKDYKYITETNKTLILNKDCNYNIDTSNLTIDSIIFESNYTGNNYIKTQKTHYSQALKKYVYVYKDLNKKEVYGYTGFDYDASPILMNLAAEAKDFSTLSGWDIGGSSGDTTGRLSITVWPSFNEASMDYPYTGESYLKVNTINSNEFLINKGFAGNSSYLPNGFVKDSKLRVRIKKGGPHDNKNFKIKITNKKNRDIIYFKEVEVIGNDSGDRWYEGILTCSKEASRADVLLNAQIEIKFNGGNLFYIKEFQIFEAIEDEKGGYYPMGNVDIGKSQQKHYYYFTENNGKAKYLYDDLEDSSKYTPVYYDNTYEKIRTLKAEKSNRFNILQSLSELFKCWIKFNIEHESDGRIKRDENNRPLKSVCFKEDIGNHLYYGFTYGIDLSSISRTIVSDQIASKVIVQENKNEIAENGSCNISDSVENYPGVNFILNFDYYIKNGLIDGAKLQNDLYLSKIENENLGYYPELSKISQSYQDMTLKLINYNKTKSRLEEYYQIYNGLYESTQKKMNDLLEEMTKLANTSNIDEIKAFIIANQNSTASLQAKYGSYKALELNLNEYKNIFNNAEKQLNIVKKNIGILSLEKEENILKDFECYIKINNDYVLVSDDAVYDPSIIYYIRLCENEYSEISFNFSNDTIQGLLNQYDTINDEFNNKYARYIQEGTWTSEDYIDPNLYYLDACKVAYESSRPQIQYNISVVRVSDIEEFKLRNFKVGDISYIEDPEFFGYVYTEDNIRTPYREEVLISESQEFFDSPEKDSFTIQNYKTQFEDLFQRITAATQSLQFNQGNYNKVSQIINSNGIIKEEVLQNSLLAASNIIQNAKNESVIQDNTGLTLTDLNNFNNKVKITSNGILLSNDGGETWGTLLDGSGIATRYLTSGQINTNIINIVDGAYPTFSWDSLGLNAYSFSTDKTIHSVNRGNFIRFDRFGLYGCNDAEDVVMNSVQEITEKAFFGLTWNGFFLNNKIGNNSIRISSDDDFVIETPDLNDSTKKVQRVKIGRIPNDKGEIIYGMRLRDENGNATLETKSDGTLWLSGVLNISNEVKIGNLEENLVFSSNGFKISNEGEIKATAGYIGSMTINDKKLVLTVPTDGDKDIFSIIGLDENKQPKNLLIVDKDGMLRVDAIISGKIESPYGKIGGFTILNCNVSSFYEKNSRGEYFKTEDTEINYEKTYYEKIEEKKDGVITYIYKEQIPQEALLFSEDDKLKIYGKTGDIYARSITLGEGATIEKYMKFGTSPQEINQFSNLGYIYNPETNDSLFIETVVEKLVSKNNENSIEKTQTFCLKTDGSMKIGNISFNGKQSKIIGGGATSGDSSLDYSWMLTPETAEFNNIIAKGSLKATTFEYGTIQTIGGMVLVRPSSIIKSSTLTQKNEIEITLENLTGFNDNSTVCINTEDSTIPVYYGTVQRSVNGLILTLSSEIPDISKLIGKTLICLSDKNNENNVGIFINGSNSSSVFGPPQSISVYEYNKDANGINSYNNRLILGKIPSGPYGTVSDSYGLYAENVYLNGAVVSMDELSDGTIYSSGINTKSTIQELNNSFINKGKILLWAGASNNGVGEPDISNANFRVDSYGNLFANSGLFSNSVISESEIRSTNIYGANIYGDDQNGALNIYDTKNGINFKYKDGEKEYNTLTILNNAFKIYNSTFIELIKANEEEGVSQALFYGTFNTQNNFLSIYDEEKIINSNSEQRSVIKIKGDNFIIKYKDVEDFKIEERKTYLNSEEIYIDKTLNLGDKISYKKVSEGYDIYVY